MLNGLSISTLMMIVGGLLTLLSLWRLIRMLRTSRHAKRRKHDETTSMPTTEREE